MSVLGY